MRGLLTIVIVAGLGIGGVVLLATGKGFVYSPYLAHARLNSVLLWSVAIFGAGAGLGALLHTAARQFPRKYYQIMWWRDVAWLACLFALLSAAGVYIWRLLA